MEALAHSGLGVRGRQALAAVVGGEDGADPGRPAAEEGAPLDQLDRVPHLGQLGRRLRARDAAADHQHRVDLALAHQLVAVRAGEANGRLDDGRRLARHRRSASVAVVDPGAALADVGDLHLQAARIETLKAARGEILRAAGEDDRAPVVLLGQLEQARLTFAAAPGRAAQHFALLGGGLFEPVEIEVGAHGAGAFAKQDARTGAVSVSGAHAFAPAISAAGTGRASAAPVGHTRAQAPQPMHLAASWTMVRKAATRSGTAIGPEGSCLAILRSAAPSVPRGLSAGAE